MFSHKILTQFFDESFNAKEHKKAVLHAGFVPSFSNLNGAKRLPDSFARNDATIFMGIATGLTTRSKKLLGTKGLTTRNQDATRGALGNTLYASFFPQFHSCPPPGARARVKRS